MSAAVFAGDRRSGGLHASAATLHRDGSRGLTEAEPPGRAKPRFDQGGRVEHDLARSRSTVRSSTPCTAAAARSSTIASTGLAGPGRSRQRTPPDLRSACGRPLPRGKLVPRVAVVRIDADPHAAIWHGQPRHAAGQHRRAPHDRLQPGVRFDQAIEVGDHLERRAGVRIEGGQPADEILHPTIMRRARAAATAVAAPAPPRKWPPAGPRPSKPWKPPGQTCSSACAAGLPDPARVGDVLVAEGLGRADVDERRRQPGQVGGTRRRGVRGDVRPPRASPSSAVQPLVRARSQMPRPAICWADGVLLRSSSIGQSSSCPASAGPPRSRASRATPRRARRPRWPRRPRSRAGSMPSSGVLGGPDQPGVAVLDRRGVRVLGREPVVDRDHGEARVRRPVQQRRQVAGAVAAADHAAAVDVVDGAGHRARPGGRPAAGARGRRRVPAR